KLAAKDVPLKDALDLDPSLRKEFDQVERLEKFVDRMVNAGYKPTEFTLRQAIDDLAVVKKRSDERINQVKGDLLQKVKQKQEGDIDSTMANLQTEIVPLEKFVAETRERAEVLIKDLDRINISSKKYDVLDSEIH